MEQLRDPQRRQFPGTTAHGLDSPSVLPTVVDQPTFTSGQFAGRQVRFELKELQKALVGRKFAKVDRRPLDPPPVVSLRILERKGPDGWEQEVAYEEVENNGFICGVDLFPVPETLHEAPTPPLETASPPGEASSSSFHRNTNTPPGAGPSYRASGLPRSPYSSAMTNAESLEPLTCFPLHPYLTAGADGAQARVSPFQIPRRQPMLAHVSPMEQPPDVVYRIGNHLITESSKLTPALVGEKYVEPTLVDHEGKKALVFVFGDLAVGREGAFILRYRAFHLFSSVPGTPVPVVAELYGGSFKVFPTRGFPGLPTSTELTRKMARYGVRVTLRDRGESGSTSGSASVHGADEEEEGSPRRPQ